MIINLRLNINGSDITVEVIETAKPGVEKVRLRWMKSPNGSFALCRPCEIYWTGGVYIAYNDGTGSLAADARPEMGAKKARWEKCPTMAERVAKIIEWAEEDGYEVPVCPFEIPDEKVRLEWRANCFGGQELYLPDRYCYAYVANATAATAGSFEALGAKADRSHTGGTLAERVELIALWARMDGFEVPPLPVVGT